MLEKCKGSVEFWGDGSDHFLLFFKSVSLLTAREEEKDR